MIIRTPNKLKDIQIRTPRCSLPNCLRTKVALPTPHVLTLIAPRIFEDLDGIESESFNLTKRVVGTVRESGDVPTNAVRWPQTHKVLGTDIFIYMDGWFFMVNVGTVHISYHKHRWYGKHIGKTLKETLLSEQDLAGGFNPVHKILL